MTEKRISEASVKAPLASISEAEPPRSVDRFADRKSRYAMNVVLTQTLAKIPLPPSLVR